MNVLQRAPTLNPIRSASGIVTVTVLTKPFPCPGRCVFCPTEARIPKSYLSTEPPVMRAIRNGYDPYAQVKERIKALENTGHATEKIELIVKGGTWSFYPESYQRWFIQRCFDAANNSEGESPSKDLREVHRRNETAHHRIVGLTIETRPDYVNSEEIRRLRELGVTRVELGVQSLNEEVLRLTQRDHTTREIRQATRLLKDAGFKVIYHLMPNLPGATPEDDFETFRMLFEDPTYRPDALKVYPCVVLKNTELYRWWGEGRYQSYDEETLVNLLIQVKLLVPPYVRIERIIRDIASPSVVSGCKKTNLRQEVLRRMREKGLRCLCIRCREVRERTKGDFCFTRRDYEASGGKEIFLSFEDPKTDRLAALLRLRIIEGKAFVRELHTYGRQLPLQGRDPWAAQHRGLGRQLMYQAERIALEEFGIPRMAVISGIGVREYYRKLGYTLADTYMVKSLR